MVDQLSHGFSELYPCVPLGVYFLQNTQEKSKTAKKKDTALYALMASPHTPDITIDGLHSPELPFPAHTFSLLL